MAGISDKALKSNYAENKYRYNAGTELQNKEFFDGSGLELYTTDHRLYDPQLGRFAQVDAYADVFENWSPYTYAIDNPVLLNDPSGLQISDSAHPQERTPVTVTGHKPAPSSTVILIDNRPQRKNPNYILGGNEPAYTHYTPGGTWDQAILKEDKPYFAAAGTLISLIPAARGLKALYTLYKITQNVKSESEASLSFTEHGAGQALKRGFIEENITKIIREGEPVNATGRYGPQTRYTLGENTVVVNDKGQIVTTYSSNIPSGEFIPFK